LCALVDDTLGEQGETMTRKDPEKEAERPHYYSQFWLDIAAGRRAIGGKTTEVEEETEPELPEPPKSVRSLREGTSTGSRRPGAAEPVRSGLTSLADLGLVIGNRELEGEDSETALEEETAEVDSPLADIAIDADLEDFDALDEEEEEFPEEEPEEDLDFDDTFYDEEEEDEWGVPRTRKSPSPHPKPKKPSPRRRERGRDY